MPELVMASIEIFLERKSIILHPLTKHKHLNFYFTSNDCTNQNRLICFIPLPVFL